MAVIVACSQENNKEQIPPVKAAVSSAPVPGDVLVSSSIGDASNLIPMLASDGASHEVANFIYNGLVKYDKNYTIVPDLAERWDIEDGGKMLRFHLRKDVYWHDGEKFDAHDVMFTYKVMIDPNTPTAYAEKYKLVKDARIIDDYTIEFTYEKPLAPALISWGALQMLPEHLLKGKDISTSELTRRPVGTGPFKFKTWETGSRIVLERNERYFDGPPSLLAVLLRVIPDQNTQFMELRAGNIDIMGLTPLQYLRQTDNADFKSRYTKYKYLADGYTFLGFNLTRPPFDDVRVRQAIAHAIDKEEIIKGVLMGLGEVATGPYKPGTRWYNPDVRRYAYDPQKALAVLKEAGYEDTDGDGVVDKDGRPLSFTIVTNQGNPLREKTAQIIQERLKTVGIQASIRVIEWTVFLKEYVDRGNFDAVILGWNILQDPDIHNVWHSDNARKGGLNFVMYRNAEVDELLVRGRHTFDEQERKRCYHRIQEILAEEQPYVFLYVPYSLPVVSSRIHGIEPAPAGIAYNMEKWFVPKELQKYQVVP
ncbi:MAG: peptide-binding protein [Desulfomonilia bacterium]|jgi:peptide/nickel transport system substrate-binding protein|nr:peptide-binding protein [Pseudomonadota bacterium]HPD22483.1 peptide-binding protein [Deltaproteobacteria bacterium]HPX19501.1 peptide-binding protein [Deltaproteobacteria bacterium]HRS57348.1 peptide-binding protein [Desulfomonilia bacterium]